MMNLNGGDGAIYNGSLIAFRAESIIIVLLMSLFYDLILTIDYTSS